MDVGKDCKVAGEIVETKCGQAQVGLGTGLMDKSSAEGLLKGPVRGSLYNSCGCWWCEGNGLQKATGLSWALPKHL